MSVSRKDFLNYLATVDYVRLMTIDHDWSSIIEECEAVYHQHPDYVWSLVYEDEAFDTWSTGQQLNQSLEQCKRWGYLPSNTINWKTTCKQPQLHMSWERDLVGALPFEENCVITPTMIPPGNTMPWHVDTYSYFKNQCGAERQQFVARILIFLKDWETGHYLQCGDSVIHHWQAGEVLIWHPDRPHVAANVGYTNRWTCNITGILQETIDFDIRA